MIDRVRRMLGRFLLSVGSWAVNVGVALDPIPIPPGFQDRLIGRLGLSVMGDSRNGYHKGGGGKDDG